MTNPFRITNSLEVYRGRVMRIREDHVVLPKGSPAIFNVAEIRPGSTVLALDERQHVHLVREYKWAVGRESVEAISGGLEEGEAPIDCARRELLEEGGLEAGDWTDMGKVDPFTSHVLSPNYMFLARNLSTVPQALEEGEVIHPFHTPLENALEMVMRGEITHAASVVLILKTARLAGLR
jgi:ADP-ribose pyrophosphatase